MDAVHVCVLWQRSPTVLCVENAESSQDALGVMMHSDDNPLDATEEIEKSGYHDGFNPCQQRIGSVRQRPLSGDEPIPLPGTCPPDRRISAPTSMRPFPGL